MLSSLRAEYTSKWLFNWSVWKIFLICEENEENVLAHTSVKFLGGRGVGVSDGPADAGGAENSCAQWLLPLCHVQLLSPFCWGPLTFKNKQTLSFYWPIIQVGLSCEMFSGYLGILYDLTGPFSSVMTFGIKSCPIIEYILSIIFQNMKWNHKWFRMEYQIWRDFTQNDR